MKHTDNVGYLLPCGLHHCYNHIYTLVCSRGHQKIQLNRWVSCIYVAQVSILLMTNGVLPLLLPPPLHLCCFADFFLCIL